MLSLNVTPELSHNHGTFSIVIGFIYQLYHILCCVHTKGSAAVLVKSLLTLAMVFIGKIDPEIRAYIKYNKDACVKDLMKETNVSRAQIYRIRKEPLRLKAMSGRLKRSGGRPEKLSIRDKRALLREIKVLRRDDGNWTVKRLMEQVNVQHVSVRTVTRFLHANGYRYLQARKKGLVNEADKKKRVTFAKKMMKEYDEDVWTKDIAFYLDGVSFVYKKNPKDQATAPTGKIWRKANEGLNSGCTSKGKKCGTGGKTVKLIVAISHRKGVLCCERYEKMDGPFFASFVEKHFSKLMKASRKRTRMWVQDGDLCQNSAIVRKVISSLNCPLLKIPPRSPDLNPIAREYISLGS